MNCLLTAITSRAWFDWTLPVLTIPPLERGQCLGARRASELTHRVYTRTLQHLKAKTVSAPFRPQLLVDTMKPVTKCPQFWLLTKAIAYPVNKPERISIK